MLAGVALLIVGLGFKVAAVPFHFWTPDVYEGAPTPVTAFMASAGKVAAFAAMLRVLDLALPQLARRLAAGDLGDRRAVTLVVGSALAVVQTNVKRMLAYSSISHAGFILVGVEAAGPPRGRARRRLGHLVVAALPAAVRGAGDRHVRRRHAGRSHRRRRTPTSIVVPRAAAPPSRRSRWRMTVLLLAQAGVPLTIGLRRQVRRHPGRGRGTAATPSAIIAMVAPVIAAFLYLRIMVSVWITEPSRR